MSTLSNFNPRARVGRDRYCGGRLPHLPISIHAPAWGATTKANRLIDAVEFQSTRPRGARRLPCPIRRRSCNFNPRARVGRDTRRLRLRQHWQHFNPRARVGRDGTQRRADPVGSISIHAPAWGATSGIRQNRFS